MSYGTIRYTRKGPIAEIRFNRPHRLNAVVTEFYAEIMDALQRAEDDPEVRVVVLTGEGRAFCVGADLKEHGAGTRTELQCRLLTADCQLLSPWYRWCDVWRCGWFRRWEISPGTGHQT